VSDLRHPDHDPDHVLEPELLVKLEVSAEPAREALKQLPEQFRGVVQGWLKAELEVERRRALAVNDTVLVEYLKLVERRLNEPGSLLRDAEAAVKVAQVLTSCYGAKARARLRVLRGGAGG
jgi:hypothetical protein